METEEDASDTESLKFENKAESQNETEFQAMDLIVGLNDTPSWYLTLLLGFQHFIIMSGSCAFGVIILFKAACVQDTTDQSNLIGSCFFVMGITTFLQSTFGTRLPIAQGPSVVFYPVAIGIMASIDSPCSTLNVNGTLENGTSTASSVESGQKEWHARIGAVAGTMAVGSVIQIIIGCTGIMSYLLKFISPLVVAPTIFLIGFSLLGAVIELCSHQFYLAITCCTMIILFTYFLDRVQVPIPYFSIRHRRMKTTRFAVFSTLPILLSMAIMYVLCYALTVTNVLPNSPGAWGYGSRTDIKSKAVSDAGWFRIPHPLQFGQVSVNGPGLVAVACAILVSIMESIGDYVTAARFCGSPSPVGFPMNRGIASEGIGCFVSGMFGLPVGPTSYSSNVAAICMTKVASRRVMQATSGMLMVFGVFPKLSSLFVCIPDPIIGGVLLPTIGLICGVATGSLRSVRMDKSRNAFVFGFSVFFGVLVPMHVKSSRRRGATLGASGWSVALEIAQDLLSNELVVGTATAALLDILLPGTRRERGLEDLKDSTYDSAIDQREQSQIEFYESAAFHRFYSKRLPLLHRLPLFPGPGRSDPDSKSDEEV